VGLRAGLDGRKISPHRDSMIVYARDLILYILCAFDGIYNYNNNSLNGNTKFSKLNCLEDFR